MPVAVLLTTLIESVAASLGRLVNMCMIKAASIPFHKRN